VWDMYRTRESSTCIRLDISISYLLYIIFCHYVASYRIHFGVSVSMQHRLGVFIVHLYGLGNFWRWRISEKEHTLSFHIEVLISEFHVLETIR